MATGTPPGQQATGKTGRRTPALNSRLKRLVRIRYKIFASRIRSSYYKVAGSTKPPFPIRRGARHRPFCRVSVKITWRRASRRVWFTRNDGFAARRTPGCIPVIGDRNGIRPVAGTAGGFPRRWLTTTSFKAKPGGFNLIPDADAGRLQAVVASIAGPMTSGRWRRLPGSAAGEITASTAPSIPGGWNG